MKDDTENLKDFTDLVIKSDAEYERLATIRDRQRRERKEELYSYHTKKHNVYKKP